MTAPHNELGNLHGRAGRYELAAESYRRAVDLGSLLAELNLAHMLELQGFYLESRLEAVVDAIVCMPSLPSFDHPFLPPHLPNPPHTLPLIASCRQGYADALAKAEATGLPQYHIQVRMKTVLPRIQPATERDLLAIRRQVGRGMRSHGFGPLSLSLYRPHPLMPQQSDRSHPSGIITHAPVSHRCSVSWTRTSTPYSPWPPRTSSSTTPPRCTSATRWATTWPSTAWATPPSKPR